MKKTYINPTLKVVKTRGARILAGSDIKVGTAYKKDGAVLGRRAEFSDWDEEE